MALEISLILHTHRQPQVIIRKLIEEQLYLCITFYIPISFYHFISIDLHSELASEVDIVSL